MRDDFTEPGRHRSSPQGQYCPTCGRHEADPWARFCGSCGATLDGPGASVTDPGSNAGATAQIPPSPAAPGGYGLAAQPHLAPAGYAAPYPPATSGPGPMVYRIPSVGLGGSARMGAAVVAAFSLVPCILVAFAGSWAVHAARQMFDSWQSASVRIPAIVTSVDVTMNFVDLLHLRPIYDTLISWDDRLWMTFTVLWLVPWVASILAGALFAIVLALIYNIVGGMGGGLRVTVTPDQAASTQGWPGPPSAASQTWPSEARR